MNFKGKNNKKAMEFSMAFLVYILLKL